MKHLLLPLCWFALVLTESPPGPIAEGEDVVYQGYYRSGVEAFTGIRFALSTAGENRFKPPVPFTPEAGSKILATSTGPFCPQSKQILDYSYATEMSEDCLRLNVWRPNGTTAGSNLAVLVWIYGGGFDTGDKDEISTDPGGMLLQSVANGHPIMHVEFNYRLGVFGFAQSAALKQEGSENAGIRDQRLAIEWVHRNIVAFGGDPHKITVHGQSSGGLGVGMQIMAYGASKPYPFQQAICESQALDLRITGNIPRAVTVRTLAKTPCNATTLDSASTVECLRRLSMDSLLEAQLSTSSTSAAQNGGDQWLPVVDGDFLPEAPSTLIRDHRFANVRTIIGWCDNDAMYFTPQNITTPHECKMFMHAYVPGLTSKNLDRLLSLYPSTDFHSSYYMNGTIELHAQAYRCGRMYRDLEFTCPPILYGQHIAAAGNQVYFYDQNQTVSTPFYEYVGYYGIGVAHTSELPYVFGNVSNYNGFPLHPTPSDIRLLKRESRSWSSFVAIGKPSLEDHDTLQGWRLAEMHDHNYGTYVIGGPYEGYSGSVGENPQSRKIMAEEKLGERCGFINSPEIVKELHY